MKISIKAFSYFLVLAIIGPSFLAAADDEESESFTVTEKAFRTDENPFVAEEPEASPQPTFPEEKPVKPEEPLSVRAETKEEPGIFMPNTFLSGLASRSKYRPKCTFIDMDCSTKKIDCFVLLCYGKKKRVPADFSEETRKRRSLRLPYGTR